MNAANSKRRIYTESSICCTVGALKRNQEVMAGLVISQRGVHGIQLQASQRPIMVSKVNFIELVAAVILLRVSNIYGTCVYE